MRDGTGKMHKDENGKSERNRISKQMKGEMYGSYYR